MNYIKQRERGRENSPEIGRNELHQQRENSLEIGRNELHRTKREREREFTGERMKWTTSNKERIHRREDEINYIKQRERELYNITINLEIYEANWSVWSSRDVMATTFVNHRTTTDYSSYFKLSNPNRRNCRLEWALMKCMYSNA